MTDTLIATPDPEPRAWLHFSGATTAAALATGDGPHPYRVWCPRADASVTTRVAYGTHYCPSCGSSSHPAYLPGK